VNSLDRLEAVLEEERVALLHLDGDTVTRCAEAKQRLVDELLATDPKDPSTLRRVRDGLRRNGVLLAQARDCLRDAIREARGDALDGTPGREHVAAGVRVSLRG
jgi:hypothetical protein